MERALCNWKPVRGSAKLARIEKKRKADNREDAEKAKVRKRDGHCRWPHLDPDQRELCRRTRTEVGHLTHKGMGGDPQTIRSRAPLMGTRVLPPRAWQSALGGSEGAVLDAGEGERSTGVPRAACRGEVGRDSARIVARVLVGWKPPKE